MKCPFCDAPVIDARIAHTADCPKITWVVCSCTDYFEGIPCAYPECTCDPRNKARWEKDYEDHMKEVAALERAEARADGADFDNLGESPDF